MRNLKNLRSFSANAKRVINKYYSDDTRYLAYTINNTISSGEKYHGKTINKNSDWKLETNAPKPYVVEFKNAEDRDRFLRWINNTEKLNDYYYQSAFNDWISNIEHRDVTKEFLEKK